MTITFGTTLRPESEEPAEVAGLLSARLGSPLRLVHVCEDPRAPLVLGSDDEHLLGGVRQELGRQAEHLARTTGARVHPHLASGPVVRTLAFLSQLDLAAMLVVGPTTPRMRSTAQRLCRASRVPVLVPRMPERLTAWLRDGTPLRILVGVDLGRAAEAARRFALTLGKLAPTEVEIALVASPEEAHARLGFDPPENGLSPEAESALRRELSDNAPDGETSASLQVIPGRERPHEHLLARADEGNFDLVIVGQRRQSVIEDVWHRSVALGVLRGARVNVATAPVPIGDSDRSFRSPGTVVVATSFADADHRALAHAVGHAEKGATLHLVHVLAPSELPSEGRQAREDACHQLSRLAREAAVDNSLLVETHVLEGHAAERLLAFSERVGADLLVLGVRKRTVVSRLLLGSLARAVIEESRIPVLLVPSRSP